MDESRLDSYNLSGTCTQLFPTLELLMYHGKGSTDGLMLKEWEKRYLDMIDVTMAATFL